MRTYAVEQRQLAPCSTAVLRSTLSVREIGPFVRRAFADVARAVAKQGISFIGPPFARYHRLADGLFEVEAGFPTACEVARAADVVPSVLPGGPAAVMSYIGPYDEMEAAYTALFEWVAERGGDLSADPWEVYLSDPSREPDPHQWRTEIVMPFTLEGAGRVQGHDPEGSQWRV